MKNFMLLIVLVCILSLTGDTILRDWKSYTNTTHIADATYLDNDIILATWGGLLFYDIQTEQFQEILLESDGLAKNELGSVGILADSTLLIGSKGNGISRFKNGEFLMPLNSSSGYELEQVFAIEAFGTNFAAVTEFGIYLFQDLENWPLPSSINYTSNNGLSANEITAIGISGDSLIVCGSDYGIDYAVLDDINNLNWQHLNSSNSPLINDHITDIHCRNGEIVISTQSGIISTKNLTDFDSWNSYHTQTPCYPVFLDMNNDIWTSEGYWDEDALTIQENSNKCLIKINSDGTEEFWTNEELGLAKGMVTSITTEDGDLLITFWGEGMIRQNGDNWSDIIARKGPAANFTFEIYTDTQQRLWAAHGLQGKPDTRRGDRGVSMLNGEDWVTFNRDNSGLISNNINSIVEAEKNLFWFTCFADHFGNRIGVNILDFDIPESPEWDFILYKSDENPNIGLPQQEVGDTFKANDGTIWFSCYQSDIVALNTDLEIEYRFKAPHIVYEEESNAVKLFQGENYTVIGGWLTGFELWLGNNIPDQQNNSNWLQPDELDFQSGFVKDAVERNELFENQIWIASSLALFMYDGDTWYRYGKDSTKRQYLDTSSSPEWQPTKLIYGTNDSPDWWYFEDQEHLYAGANTYPTALFVDPFNVLWIGTANNGICRYDIENNLFKTWNKDNSPLLSNIINDLSYDDRNGLLYIATPEGINSVRIGIGEEKNKETAFRKVVAFPNPFYPAKDEIIRIENIDSQTMPSGTESCSIFDLEGLLIRELNLNHFQQYEWDGRNSAGRDCSSGIYFYLIVSQNGSAEKGKIILIR